MVSLAYSRFREKLPRSVDLMARLLAAVDVSLSQDVKRLVAMILKRTCNLFISDFSYGTSMTDENKTVFYALVNTKLRPGCDGSARS